MFADAEGVVDAALLGVVVVEFEDAAHERHDVGLATVQFHLVLFEITNHLCQIQAFYHLRSVHIPHN